MCCRGFSNFSHCPIPSNRRPIIYQCTILLFCQCVSPTSKESVSKIRNKLREAWLSLRGSNVLAIIKRLNPMIRGWANYLRSGVSCEIFHSLDRWMFHRTVRYVKHTHPKKPRYWRQNQYWGRLNLERNDRWVFGDKTTGLHLLKFSWFKIERHILVKGKSSRDDPNLKSYWQDREKAKSKSLTPSKQKIAQNQGCHLS